MRMKENMNLVEFLKKVQCCKQEVYLETDDGDKLNLKSVLSQYMVIVLAENQNEWNHTKLICCEEDMEILSEYLENM